MTMHRADYEVMRISTAIDDFGWRFEPYDIIIMGDNFARNMHPSVVDIQDRSLVQVIVYNTWFTRTKTGIKSQQWLNSNRVDLVSGLVMYVR